MSTASFPPPLLLAARSELMRDGTGERALRALLRAGVLTRVRRGWYADAGGWDGLSAEQRHVQHVRAVMRDGAGTSVVSHVSAAALHGLPLYRCWPARVHLTVPSPTRISSCPDVFRHVADLASEDIVEVDGMPCTSLARTVFDVARTLPAEAALACADAAERLVGSEGRAWDEDARSVWREDLARRVGVGGGTRGIRQARWLLPFADGDAQLPGESVSRLQLHRLGFAAPRLQVPVAGPGGGTFYVDFALDDVRAFGEFDGAVKYTDAALRGGRTAEEVVLAEKRREDWIRGTTQYRFVRWGAEHTLTPRHLAAHLASFGIRPPR